MIVPEPVLRSLPLWVALTLVACKAPSTSSSTAHEPTTVDAPRAAEPSASENAEPAAAGDADAIVVGVLHRRGLYVCKDGEPPDRGRWVDVHPVVGFVPLIAGQQLNAGAESLYGKPVAVHGRVREGRPLVPEPGTAPCMFPMQMRSDYVNSPDGMRVQRKPQPLAAFAPSRIAHYDGLSARATDAGVEVTFVNRLGRALTSPLVLRAHYEGCYGKPGTAEIERRAEQGLADGKSFTTTFPRIETRSDRPERRQVHSLASIEVDASGDRIWFDLDVGISALGVKLSCDEFR